MKDGIKEIIGKTVASVVIARNTTRRPHEQIFLIFDDETSYEIYGDDFTCAGGIDRMDIARVLRYARLATGTQITHVYLGKVLSSRETIKEFGHPQTGKYLH